MTTVHSVHHPYAADTKVRKHMTSKEYKALSVREFTKAAEVYESDHAGVYIGNGEIVEAAGTAVGIIKTKVAQRDLVDFLLNR